MFIDFSAPLPFHILVLAVHDQFILFLENGRQNPYNRTCFAATECEDLAS